MTRKRPGFAETPGAACPRCHGTGFAIGERDGYSFAIRCACKVPAVPRGVATIPPKFREARFDTFAERTPSLKKAKATVVHFARVYPAVDGGIFLIGPDGVGKTHLATALLNVLGERGFPGLYFDYRELLGQLRGTFDRGAGPSSLEVLEPIMTAALVVLDGVGDETPTDWVNDTLSRIVNHRYNHRLITVATSRFVDGRTVKDGKLAPRGGAAGPVLLEERIGSALLSRLYEMCQFVPMDAEDFRAHVRTAAFHG